MLGNDFPICTFPPLISAPSPKSCRHQEQNPPSPAELMHLSPENHRGNGTLKEEGETGKLQVPNDTSHNGSLIHRAVLSARAPPSPFSRDGSVKSFIFQGNGDGIEIWCLNRTFKLCT